MTKKGLLIFGATSLAKLAHYYATRDMGMNVLGFVVDEQYKNTDTFLSLPVLIPSDIRSFNKTEVAMYVAVGYRSMHQRANAYEQATKNGFELVNIIANASFVADDVVMGDNNFVMPGVMIEPGVKIGSNNVLWSNGTVCHDTTIGNHNFIASNVTIGGEATIGDQNFIGFSSTILQQRHIENNVLIGAQSLVLTNIESLTQVRGSPAKKISVIDPHVGVCVN
jgi:sugar O-acyltransferase (sialic acid O-acetyltransferase NeuD family)